MKIFFTSDTHWGHRNVIHYDNRPWDTVEEMNEALIENWNNVVSEGDVVYHLGDVALCGWEKAVAILSRLKGKKHLLRGNHDTQPKVRDAFVSCHKSLIVEVGETRLFLQHVHLGLWPGKRDGVIHLHGHSHGHGRKIKGRIDVGCMLWNYRPVELEEILGSVEGEEE